MLRYYTETHIDTGKITLVVAQDETGIWCFTAGGLDDGYLYSPPEELYRIKLPEWKEARWANGADPALLEFQRTWERGSQPMDTIPSEIREVEGDPAEIARKILKSQS